VANWSMWSPSNQSSTYWVFLVVNNDVTMDICNL
jgi:hypothetical protein